MITLQDLINDIPLPDNYFAPKTYIQSDLELGLIENRSGGRLLAIPDTLIKALYAGLEQETGLASRMVLFNCGNWWGRNFYKRLSDELTSHYRQSFGDLPMAEFIQALQQCWTTHGWGRFELDQRYQAQGLLRVSTWNSPFAAQAPIMDRPVCFLDAGIFAAFFGQLAGRELGCVQISCESLGSDCNRFVVGLASRLEPVEEMLDQKLDHEAIFQALLAPG
jgi:uncharacterized protein